jgi:hypothetical protein
MGNTWYAIPSKRPPEQVEPVLAAWRERGYKTALMIDEGGSAGSADYFNSVMPYLGYAESVNWLVRDILRMDSACDWIVTGGDDVYPDPNQHARSIATQCKAYFHGLNRERGVPLSVGCEAIDTFGVMQPTGDRWGDDALSRARYGKDRGAYIDRVCGSPWMGREFCQRIYGGKGPLWPEFTHMYVDEHLQCVAEKLGILWQRPDLTQRHEHWGRQGDATKMPEFLKHANSSEEWAKSQAIFERLKSGGFAEATL